MSGEDLNNLVQNRRSIRKYTSEQISADNVKMILEAALWAPSSKNSHPWHFIIVDNPETLIKMSSCRAIGTIPLKSAVLAVVVCADSSLSDVWVEDCSIAASYMQLQAAALGLGSCWVQVRERFSAEGIPAEEIIQEILGIPEHVNVECIVTFGHKDEIRKPLDPTKTLWEKIHIDKWIPSQAE